MKPLILLTPEQYDVEISLSYAGCDNFTGTAVYREDAGAYLHEDAAAALRRVIDLLAAQGLRLRIYDAYRPQEAQERLWNHTPNDEFIVNPRRGSPHSRGVAVDVTLLDGDGAPLDMGTDFDSFTSKSHHGTEGLSPSSAANRYLLLGAMVSAGWDYFRNEWWHYQLPHASSYPLIHDGEAAPCMMHDGGC